MDTAPDTWYSHPTKLWLLDANSGKWTKRDMQSWPVLKLANGALSEERQLYNTYKDMSWDAPDTVYFDTTAKPRPATANIVRPTDNSPSSNAETRKGTCAIVVAGPADNPIATGDQRAMARAATKRGIERVTQVYGDKNTLYEALQKAATTKCRELLFSFSGHSSSQGLIFSHSISEDDGENGLFRWGDLRKALEATGAQQFMVVLDTSSAAGHANVLSQLPGAVAAASGLTDPAHMGLFTPAFAQALTIVGSTYEDAFEKVTQRGSKISEQRPVYLGTYVPPAQAPTPASVPSKVTICADLQLQDGSPWRDSYKPGINQYNCAWYGEKPSRCSDKYAYQGKSSKQACCACNGGASKTCDDKTLLDGSPYQDSTGKGCDYYSSQAICAREGSLERFRNQGMLPRDACCACRGGSGDSADPTGGNGGAGPTVPENAQLQPKCEDATTHTGEPYVEVLKSGRKYFCSWYAEKDTAQRCEKYGNIPSAAADGMTAAEACCACGNRPKVLDCRGTCNSKQPCLTLSSSGQPTCQEAVNGVCPASSKSCSLFDLAPGSCLKDADCPNGQCGSNGECEAVSGGPRMSFYSSAGVLPPAKFGTFVLRRQGGELGPEGDSPRKVQDHFLKFDSAMVELGNSLHTTRGLTRWSSPFPVRV